MSHTITYIVPRFLSPLSTRLYLGTRNLLTRFLAQFLGTYRNLPTAPAAAETDKTWPFNAFLVWCALLKLVAIKLVPMHVGTFALNHANEPLSLSLGTIGTL